MYDIQHCFICRPSDSTVSEDAGIERMQIAHFLSISDEKNSDKQIFNQTVCIQGGDT